MSIISESEFFRLSHNVNNLVYHFICPEKYRRIVFDEDVDIHLRQIFAEWPQVKKKLWGGQFWADGYFVGQ